jgi:hypothetical protein
MNKLQNPNFIMPYIIRTKKYVRINRRTYNFNKVYAKYIKKIQNNVG